ncbi:uncharacterized protein LOC113505728 [Trichoplusia ni]|uniref:Uncharacterized protein LOC113505728 n=1 Tax=Trichoplusia ni TaxID=7111 RepID=A0A7E5WU26_TRINI|nr:uncharacterized protein LOC113505728 [Trichoplusia ni]
MDRFDTELFIDEVEKRPALWDIQCAEYSNKIIRNGAWQELVEIFGENEDSLEKKVLFGVTLQKKWKNIRDAYNKEFKKGKSIPSGSGALPNKRKKTKITSEERLADILENSIESRDKIQRQLQESNTERAEITSAYSYHEPAEHA